ncbi:aldose epimerase family protein [Agrilactobacillus yilanensis]|uniref:Maltose epimerase n=1 Tax=Agrilactobacillus yilanensis TaxID=2485997 RepID=A0ABW4J8A0_9LACO|nr:aldose epimerase family protein [Agrilactobacillus yilanensis]
MTESKITATTTQLDTYQDKPIYEFTLTNQNNVSISAISLGATFYKLLVPTKTQQRTNLILNFFNSADYPKNGSFAGMAVGRTAGRIGDGQIILDQQTYQLPQNEGTTTLHGGPNGFSSEVWNGSIVIKDGQPAILFHHLQKSEDDGFPGDLDTTIMYQLTENDEVKVTFTGRSTAKTVFNPTIHTYFNLGDTEDILEHQLLIRAAEHLELDAKNVPTGQFLEVDETPFNFQNGQRLGTAIDAVKDTPHHGFDDIFKVTPNTKIAKLTDPATQRSVTITSDRNALVIFTANEFSEKEDMNFVRTNGVGKPYMGVAMEAQNLPDTTKHNNFGSDILPANETVQHHISYKVSY